MRTLSIVVPCYNEEAVFPETCRRLDELLGQMKSRGMIADDSHVLFVDDGSRDQTWKLIEQANHESANFQGLKLARNVGHQRALYSGLMCATGDWIISVDADLQDDLNVMFEMLSHALAGSEVVYGVRRRRDKDTFFKRATAEGYYKLLALFGVDIVFNHADYRLMTRKAIEALRDYREVNLFLRGLIKQIGFTSSNVFYDREERFAGESKYPLSKMLALAWQGITSFSATPLRLITLTGITIAMISLSLSVWAMYIKLFTHTAVPGWASSVVPTFFLGGVQLLCLGVVGEYVAKIYLESKHRPHFHVDQLTYGDPQVSRSQPAGASDRLPVGEKSESAKVPEAVG